MPLNTEAPGTNADTLKPPPAAPAPRAAFGEADFAQFQRRVEAKTGILLSQYKSDQMRRRIASLAEKEGCPSFEAYAQKAERDPATLACFLDRMTINVTELLRNPSRFEELAAEVLPGLLARRRGAPVSAWSAGCSYGAEAYTLAMLLHEAAPAPPHRIKGTDLDRGILAKAEQPCFSGLDMANVSPARREAHFHADSGGYRPKSHLRAKVRFSPHDLLAGPYPASEYDLILCRNVVIYFTDEARERVFRGFFRALTPGGVLFVGGTERLPDHRAVGFELLRPFFYRKPG